MSPAATDTLLVSVTGPRTGARRKTWLCPPDLRYSITAPGGFDELSATLSWPDPANPPTQILTAGAAVRVTDRRTGDTVWYGYLDDPGDTWVWTGSGYKITATGPRKILDEVAATYALRDRELGNWANGTRWPQSNPTIGDGGGFVAHSGDWPSDASDGYIELSIPDNALMKSGAIQEKRYRPLAASTEKTNPENQICWIFYSFMCHANPGATHHVECVVRDQAGTEVLVGDDQWQSAQKDLSFSAGFAAWTIDANQVYLRWRYQNTASAVTVSNRAISSNVATLTTSAAHGFAPGQIVTVAGMAVAALNGTFVIDTTPSTTTFTYNVAAANSASAADTGTATIVGYQRISDGYVRFANIAVIFYLVDKLGNRLTSTQSVQGVHAGGIMHDMIGRMLVGKVEAGATVFYPTSPAVDQAAWWGGATAREIADFVQDIQPDYWWAVWEPGPSGKPRFEYRPWVTSGNGIASNGFRYYLTPRVADLRFTGGLDDVFNRALVVYSRADGVPGSVVVSGTVADLTNLGQTRTTIIDISDRGPMTGGTASAIGVQELAKVNLERSSGSAVVSGPVLDRITGRTVYPWELLPGWLARTSQPADRTFSVPSYQVQDGVCQFRVTQVVFDASSGTAELTLDGGARSLFRRRKSPAAPKARGPRRSQSAPGALRRGVPR